MGGDGGGGQKFSLRTLQAVGKRIAVTQPVVERYRSPRKVFGWRFEAWPTVGGAGGGAILTLSGFEPPTKNVKFSRITV